MLYLNITTFGYDAEGNNTTSRMRGGTRHLRFDADNTSVRQGLMNNVTTYVYDADNDEVTMITPMAAYTPSLQQPRLKSRR